MAPMAPPGVLALVQAEQRPAQRRVPTGTDEPDLTGGTERDEVELVDTP